MDNNLSSILQGLNSYHQRTKIDKESAINGKISIYSGSGADGETVFHQSMIDITTDYPDPNSYEILDVTFSGGDGAVCWVFVIIRVN